MGKSPASWPERWSVDVGAHGTEGSSPVGGGAGVRHEGTGQKIRAWERGGGGPGDWPAAATTEV